MLDTLARMLGLSRTEAEESLHSERAARHVLTRRDAFGLAGAMCAGSLFKFWSDPLDGYEFRMGAYGSLVLPEPLGLLFREGDFFPLAARDWIVEWIPTEEADG